MERWVGVHDEKGNRSGELWESVRGRPQQNKLVSSYQKNLTLVWRQSRHKETAERNLALEKDEQSKYSQASWRYRTTWQEQLQLSVLGVGVRLVRPKETVKEYYIFDRTSYLNDHLQFAMWY